MPHPTDRLSVYLDGDLSPEEEKEVEEHLEGCAECADVLEGLRAVVRRAGALQDRPPLQDLWPGVEAGIREGRPEVIDLTRRRSEVASPPGRTTPGVTMPAPWLAAAVVALVSISGAGAWMLRGALESPAGERASQGPPGLVPVSSIRVPTRFESYAAEVQELQRLLTNYRDQLDPATVRAFEKSLAVIDRAIEESREALEEDPGNEYLVEHLEGTLRRKVQFLRETATTIRTAS